MSKLDERLEQASAEVRRHMQRIPLPPIREQRMRRRRAVVAVAMGAVAVTAIATPLVFLGRNWLSGSTSTTGASPMPASEPDVIFWLSGDVSDDALGRAVAEAMTWEGVTYAALFDRDMTLAEFREVFGEEPELVAIVEADPSVLPVSIRLWLGEPTEARAIADLASQRLVEIGVVVAQARILGETREPLVTTVPETTAGSTTTIPGAACGVPAAEGPRLGVGHVWPEEPRTGTPADVATAFAVEVLGWTDATVTADPEADPTGPVWVRIQQPGFAALDVATSPAGGGGRVLMQVGSPPASGAMEPLEDPPGSWISLEAPAGAVLADVTVRAAGDPALARLVFVASGPELTIGRIELTQVSGTPEGILRAQDIQTVLIRYRNLAGCVVGAAGGHGYGLPAEQYSIPG